MNYEKGKIYLRKIFYDDKNYLSSDTETHSTNKLILLYINSKAKFQIFEMTTKKRI